MFVLVAGIGLIATVQRGELVSVGDSVVYSLNKRYGSVFLWKKAINFHKHGI